MTMLTGFLCKKIYRVLLGHKNGGNNDVTIHSVVCCTFS